MRVKHLQVFLILTIGILRTKTANSQKDERDEESMIQISGNKPFRRSTDSEVLVDQRKDIVLHLRSKLEFEDLHVDIQTDSPGLLRLTNPIVPRVIRHGSSENTREFQVPVEGLFLGRGGLRVQAFNVSNQDSPPVVDQSSQPIFEDVYTVLVLRDEEGERLSKLFTGLMIIVFAVNNFLMGTQLDMQIIFECVKKPVGPAIGVFCQFCLMPLIAYGWGWAILRNDPTLWLGYFAVGCSPGGGASNFMTILLDGNIDLSVTMTFFSNFAAFILMPLWLYTLTRTFYPEFVDIPFFNIFASLLGLIIPACIGLAFISWRPEYAKKCRRWIKVTTVVILILIFIFGVYANMYIFYLITWHTILAGLLLPWTGYLLAFGIAFSVKQPIKDCWTIAIETGIQNAGIPIVLLKLSLPEPDGDLSLVIPICVNLLTTIPLWLLLLGRKMKSLISGRGSEIERQRASFDSIENEIEDEDFSGYEPKLSTNVEPTRVEFCRQSSEIICSQKDLPSKADA